MKISLFDRMHKPHSQDLVVTIHGFGWKTSAEMDPLAAFLKSHGYQVMQFSYFDPNDTSDTSAEKWIERCEEKIREAFASGKRVWLLGFSMGGVIASYLATIFRFQGLILCAPAFYPFDFSKVEKAARNTLSSSSGEKSMSAAHTRAFTELVSRYRASMSAVDCPVLILHGSDDEIIQCKSSRKAFSQIPSVRKNLIIIEGGRHRFLYDGTVEPVAFAIILDFLRGEFS